MRAGLLEARSQKKMMTKGRRNWFFFLLQGRAVSSRRWTHQSSRALFPSSSLCNYCPVYGWLAGTFFLLLISKKKNPLSNEGWTRKRRLHFTERTLSLFGIVDHGPLDKVALLDSDFVQIVSFVQLNFLSFFPPFGCDHNNWDILRSVDRHKEMVTR